MAKAYRYQGALALVRLHERQLGLFLKTWRQAKAAGLRLPSTQDPDYASLDSLLRHVLSSSRGYLNWICGSLGLDDPGIDPPPGPERIAVQADAYAGHLLHRWSLPLAGVDENRFFQPQYPSNWGPDYCIEAMLEHAVSHPMRHELQLMTLMGESAP